MTSDPNLTPTLAFTIDGEESALGELAFSEAAWLVQQVTGALREVGVSGTASSAIRLSLVSVESNCTTLGFRASKAAHVAAQAVEREIRISRHLGRPPRIPRKAYKLLRATHLELRQKGRVLSVVDRSQGKSMELLRLDDRVVLPKLEARPQFEFTTTLYGRLRSIWVVKHRTSFRAELADPTDGTNLIVPDDLVESVKSMLGETVQADVVAPGLDDEGRFSSAPTLLSIERFESRPVAEALAEAAAAIPASALVPHDVFMERIGRGGR